eukprot:CAMPEP_0119549406 /NCGR_PEP_ID=MMETSP1352-20130426/3103_1 /TAXON_ID=265584 /ORGANISM="Stauroneis constricta, Strain CCMP1120" /LENGTH=307 /DNA_ID=CAMNT_0007594943 /DNA_START=102 /DNA_END=1022 /DNA_ORIENTATION=-
MKRPTDQAKLLLFALLRSTTTTALAVTGDKAAAASSTMLRMASSSAGVEAAAAAAATGPTAIFPNIQLRLARRTDVPSIQRCNLACLPENYNSQFYCGHLRQWPDLAIVAEHLEDDQNQNEQQQQRRPFGSFPGLGRQQQTSEPKIVAYVLGKIELRPVFDSNTFNHNNDNNNNNWMIEEEQIGHVTSLAVLHEYRRQGLANELMKQLHFQLNTKTCGLHVRKSNHAAYKLYENDGYEINKIIPSYYQDGEDAYFMKKVLSSQHASTNMLLQDDNSHNNNNYASQSDLQLPRKHIFPPHFRGMKVDD